MAHRAQVMGSDEPTRAMSLLPGAAAAARADDQVTAEDAVPQGDMTQAEVVTGDLARAMSAVVTAAWAPEVTMPDHGVPDHGVPDREVPGHGAPPGAAEQEAAGRGACEQDAAQPFPAHIATADFSGRPV